MLLRIGVNRSKPSRIAQRAHWLLVALVAAGFGALVAHTTIDLLGDVLLVRDAYDREGHASRVWAALGGLAAMGALLGRSVAAIVAEALGSIRSLRSAVTSIGTGCAWPFVATVVCLTAVLVAAMGAVDARCALRSIDDAGDLLGGSLLLGPSVCAAAGIAAAFAARWIARRLHASRTHIVAAVSALLSALTARAVQAELIQVCADRRAPRRLLSTVAGLAGNRAPPLLLN